MYKIVLALPKEENTIECFLTILDLTGFEIIILKSNSYYKISCTSFEGADSTLLIFPIIARKRGCTAPVGICNHWLSWREVSRIGGENKGKETSLYVDPGNQPTCLF